MNMNFDMDKLNNMNVGDFLSDEEKSQMAEIFNQVGMEDWVYEPNDNSMRLRVKIINNSNNPDPKYQKEGDWYLPEDMNNGMVYELPPIKSPFTVELELSLDENVETIDVEGEYYDDEDTIKIQNAILV